MGVLHNQRRRHHHRRGCGHGSRWRGSSGVVRLGLDTTKVPQLATPNSFTGAQTIAGNLALTGSGNGVQFPDGTLQTTAATSGGAEFPRVS